MANLRARIIEFLITKKLQSQESFFPEKGEKNRLTSTRSGVRGCYNVDVWVYKSPSIYNSKLDFALSFAY